MIKHILLLCLAFALWGCDKDGPTGPARDNNLALGNPSGATADDADNYLHDVGPYIMSYNSGAGRANWVSWHLSPDWKGSAVRQDRFIIDPALPTDFYRASTNVYTNTGFDRGHLCPSDDRDSLQAENDITFYMSNIVPQAPSFNRGNWAALESYCRQLVADGNECYIVAGPLGSGGSGNLGGTTYALDAGKLDVPEYLWKIIVVLPQGGDDICRIDQNTQVIAVLIPNTNAANAQDWDFYRTTVDDIEAQTGFDFFTELPNRVEQAIEAKLN